MKRIIRISGLRSCGVFRDFTWPSDLPEFGQYNVIYGWNGTGKTTLSRLLRDLELRRAPTVGAAVLRIDGSDVPGTDFPRSTLQVRVFNRDFIHQNVFPVEHSDLPPILVLGAEYVGRQKEVERLKKRAATARSELEYSRSAEERAGRDFDRFLADRARVIKDTLRTSGRSQYNNYNKAGFHGDAEEMAKAGSSTTHGLTAEECERLHARHRATPKARVAEVVYAMPDLKVIGDRVAEILTETVVSAAIGALKGDPRLADWSREGLTLHRDRRAERCLFCEQPLPADRVAALEAHFSAGHEQVLRRIDEQIRGLEGTSKASTELRLPSKAQLYDDLGSEFQTREAEVVQALRAVRDFLGAAVQALEDKKHRVFEQVTLGAGVIPACTGRRPTQANGSVRLVPLAPKSPSAPNLSLRRAPASPGHATTPWPSANLPPKGLTCSVIIAV